MMIDCKVAVTSRTFSRHPVLREELQRIYKQVKFNSDGLSLSGDELVDFLSGHDRAIIALERIDEIILKRLPDLKVISKFGVGLDTIDEAVLARYGVSLGWTPGVNRRSVAELVICCAIMLLRNVKTAIWEMTEGIWRQHVGAELSGRVVGIIGCGNIGKDVVRLLRPFDCKIIAHDIANNATFYHENQIEAVSLPQLLSMAEVITIHVPYDSSTKDMIGPQELELVQEQAVLINFARGGIVNEHEVLDRLRRGLLGGAAFDVFAQEPPSNFDLLEHPNFIATPHIGGSSAEAILAMGRAAIRGLREPERW